MPVQPVNLHQSLQEVGRHQAALLTFPCRRWVAPRQTFTCPCRRWGATRLPIYSCPCIRWVATNLPTFTSPCRSWDTTRLPTFTCPCRRWGAPDCLQSPTASVQPTNWPCPASPAPCCGEEEHRGPHPVVGGHHLQQPWPASLTMAEIAPATNWCDNCQGKLSHR